MKPIRGLLASLSLALALGACKSAAPMGDALLLDFKPASSDDVTRYERAREAVWRKLVSPNEEYVPVAEPNWPLLYVSFRSSRRLFVDQGPLVRFSLCESKGQKAQLWEFQPEVMWQGRILSTDDDVREIQAALEKGPQTYEIFFRYAYYDHSQGSETVTLLPLQDDLCIAAERINWPFAPSVGRPMRIGKEIVNQAAAPLPRTMHP